MDPDLRAMTNKPWAIAPSHGSAFLESLTGMAASRSAGAKPNKSAEASAPKTEAGVRYLAMAGPLLFKPPAWLAEWGITYTDTLGLAAQINQANADSSVSSIVINADTPGGMCAGMPELFDAINNASKPIEVRVDGMLASGGMYAAAGADRIVATRTSEIGCIGVYTVLVDDSKAIENAGYKLHLVSSGGMKGHGADGHVTQDMLTESARLVGQLRDAFVSALNQGRGKDLSKLATGEIWLAADAKRLGLIDTIIKSSATPDIEDTMDLAKLKALAAKHPNKAVDILNLAAEGKTDDQIETALAESLRADELAAAKKSADEFKAAAERAVADLKVEQEAHAKTKAELATLQAADTAGKAKIEALKAGANDPGQDPPKESELPKFTKKQAAEGSIPKDLLHSGKYILTP